MTIQYSKSADQEKIVWTQPITQERSRDEILARKNTLLQQRVLLVEELNMTDLEINEIENLLVKCEELGVKLSKDIKADKKNK